MNNNNNTNKHKSRDAKDQKKLLPWTDCTTIWIHSESLKGALSDICQIMLIFESTKTNTPIPQKDLIHILKSPPHLYVHNHGNDDAETSEDDSKAYSDKSQHG